VVTPITPTTGIDSLDKALSAIDTLGIGNFDGQGSIAPEKAEIQAEVVGTATLKENLWFVRQQREVLKTRAGDMLEGKLMFGATPISKDQPTAVESFAVSPSVYDEESTSLNTTMNTSLNSTRMDTSVRRSPHVTARGSDACATMAMPTTRSEGKYEPPPTLSPREQVAPVTKTISYPGEARTDFAKRVSETAKSTGLQRVVGLHVPLATGLRVKPVDGTLAHSQGGAGFVTKVNSDLDACFVKWDMTEEECGWYRCGAYGNYTLRLLPPDEEKPSQVMDMMTTGGNATKDIENRNMDYREKNGMYADNLVVSLFDMFGM